MAAQDAAPDDAQPNPEGEAGAESQTTPTLEPLTFWGHLRGIVVATLLAYGIFGLAFYGGYKMGMADEASHVGGDLKRADLRENLENEDRTGNFVKILRRNIAAMVGVLGGGALTGGLSGVVMMLIIGAQFGAKAGELHGSGISGEFLLAYHMAHGIIEILAISIAIGIGFRLGVGYFRYLILDAGPPLRPGDLKAHVITAVVAFVLLVIGAVIEAYFMPPYVLQYL